MVDTRDGLFDGGMVGRRRGGNYHESDYSGGAMPPIVEKVLGYGGKAVDYTTTYLYNLSPMVKNVVGLFFMAVLVVMLIMFIVSLFKKPSKSSSSSKKKRGGMTDMVMGSTLDSPTSNMEDATGMNKFDSRSGYTAAPEEEGFMSGMADVLPPGIQGFMSGFFGSSDDPVYMDSPNSVVRSEDREREAVMALSKINQERQRRISAGEQVGPATPWPTFWQEWQASRPLDGDGIILPNELGSIEAGMY
jgi:hypothetical protein